MEAVLVRLSKVNLLLPLAKVGTFLLKSVIGGRKRPVFFDVEKDYPELLEISKNYSVIKEELENILPKENEFPRYHDLDSFQNKISDSINQNKNWRVFLLQCYGYKPTENRNLCPKTCAILDKIPTVGQAFFSILDGGKSIPPHAGPYLGIVRYQLALKVPKHNPPTIRIKDQYYTWREGESVMFDDTWDHEVFNHSEDSRVVLFVDVIRHMPPFWNWVNRRVLSTLGTRYGRFIMKNMKWNH